MDSAWATLEHTFAQPGFDFESGEMKAEVQTLNLNEERYRIGRSVHCEIVLKQHWISNRHCLIFTKFNDVEYGEDEGFRIFKAYVKDLSSTNGTSLNDTILEKGEERELRSGDVICLGAKFTKSSKSSLPLFRYIPKKFAKSKIKEIKGKYAKVEGSFHESPTIFQVPGNEDLQQHNNNLSAELDKVLRQLHEARSEIAELKQPQEADKEKTSHHDMTVSKLRKELEESKSAKAALEKEKAICAKLKDDIATLETNMKNRVSQLKSVLDVLRAENQMIRREKHFDDKKERRLERLENGVKELRPLKRNLVKARENVTKQKGKVNDLIKIIDHNKTQIKQKEIDLSEIEKKLANREKELKENKKETRRLSKSLFKANAELRGLKEQTHATSKKHEQEANLSQNKMDEIMSDKCLLEEKVAWVNNAVNEMARKSDEAMRALQEINVALNQTKSHTQPSPTDKKSSQQQDSRTQIRSASLKSRATGTIADETESEATQTESQVLKNQTQPQADTPRSKQTVGSDESTKLINIQDDTTTKKTYFQPDIKNSKTGESYTPKTLVAARRPSTGGMSRNEPSTRKVEASGPSSLSENAVRSQPSSASKRKISAQSGITPKRGKTMQKKVEMEKKASSMDISRKLNESIRSNETISMRDVSHDTSSKRKATLALNAKDVGTGVSVTCETSSSENSKKAKNLQEKGKTNSRPRSIEPSSSEKIQISSPQSLARAGNVVKETTSCKPRAQGKNTGQKVPTLMSRNELNPRNHKGKETESAHTEVSENIGITSKGAKTNGSVIKTMKKGHQTKHTVSSGPEILKTGCIGFQTDMKRINIQVLAQQQGKTAPSVVVGDADRSLGKVSTGEVKAQEPIMGASDHSQGSAGKAKAQSNAVGTTAHSHRDTGKSKVKSTFVRAKELSFSKLAEAAIEDTQNATGRATTKSTPGRVKKFSISSGATLERAQDSMARATVKSKTIEASQRPQAESATGGSLDRSQDSTGRATTAKTLVGGSTGSKPEAAEGGHNRRSQSELAAKGATEHSVGTDKSPSYKQNVKVSPASLVPEAPTTLQN